MLLIALSTLRAAPVNLPMPSGITIGVTPDGSFSIQTRVPAFSFGGKLGAPAASIVSAQGLDSLGAFFKISFQFTPPGGVPTNASIRAYNNRPVVIFSSTLLQGENNSPLFPTLSTYPQGLFKFGFAFTYLYQYGPWGQGPDSPWAYFDASGNTFIFSPASHFPIVWNVQNQDGSISAGINASIPALPEGFTQDTMLVFGQGINHTWDLLGQALTDLGGKIRPGNDSDVSLSKLSYWTDSASTYYYNYVPSMGYEGTLMAVKQDFANHGLPVGTVQLDSWWYPKGNPPAWNNLGATVDKGQYELQPDLTILPDGLGGVQKMLGVPLLVHARWVDPTSPVRQQYQMSGNVSIDPNYWYSTAQYLASNGVMMYEQDWLSIWAQPNMDLTDPETYLDLMAHSMASVGITLQYSGQTVGQMLQGSKYSNLTTARVSGDGFNQTHWDPFLYNARLTTVAGVFPFSDNVYSTDIKGLVLATNSAGTVAMADAMGKEVAANIVQVIRPDGVIVKPDGPMMPLDLTYVADARAEAANGPAAPMLAYSYTNHGMLRTAYVFAYSRNSDGSNAPISFSATDVGIPVAAYVYDYFGQRGRLVSAGTPFTDNVTVNASYYVVAPVGNSGMALVGDTGKFVSSGRQRISSVVDDGTLSATVDFAPAEPSTTIWGYSPTAPSATVNGTAANVSYDPVNQVFMLTVVPAAGAQTATVALSR
jgi:hypothetical protein